MEYIRGNRAQFCCTIILEKLNQKDAETESYTGLRGNRFAEMKWKADARMCVVCRVGTQPQRRTWNGELLYTRLDFGRWCTNQRHQGDPVTGTCGSGGQCGNRKLESGTSRRTKDIRENGVYVCRCVLCVPKCWDQWYVSRSTTTKAEARGEVRKRKP